MNPWQECERCDRHLRRLRVFAPAWPLEVRVVVLVGTATRATQAVGNLEPAHGDVVQALRERLGLGDHECVGDVLVACGLGGAGPDHAAACSARFIEHLAKGCKPQVFVFLGSGTHRLAEQAGLLQNGTWGPVGWQSSAALVVAEELEDAVRGVGDALNLADQGSRAPSRAGLEARAGRLRAVLGRSRGYRRKDVGDTWKTKSRAILTKSVIEGHLAGECWVSAFDPIGPGKKDGRTWSFVVIDVDRHSAIQVSRFDEVIRTLRAKFPTSLFMRSSSSGGVHVYVRIPVGLSYQDAALWLRAYVALLEIRFHDLAVGDRVVRAQVVEVPSSPPRLPFGEGSHILGDMRRLTAQMHSFAAFVRGPGCDDFLAAQEAVVGRLGLGRFRDKTKRVRLERHLLDLETKDIPLRALHPADC